MADDLGTYSFLPWLRRGIATEIEREEGAGPAAPRATVPITLAVGAGSETRTATVRLALHGPGEVGGLDTRTIIRTYPRAGVMDAESNLFPALELHQADFPWRYTPARANARERLRPWLVLVVLADDEIEGRRPPGKDGSLPAIQASPATLPDLAQSWAWAHVQVSGLAEGANAETAAAVAEREPERVTARLLCPRRLLPRTAYTAFVVPAFERGRRSGLNEEMDETLDALVPAWTAGGGPVWLPVYYEWRFQTGVAGDFEYLVRQLVPRRLPDDVGLRPMDVSDPAPELALPPASAALMDMEGALWSTEAESTPWPPPEQATWEAALGDLVNLPAELLESGEKERVVAPPLYVRWHAARERLEPGQPPPWFQELNADPRLRAAAGLGARVVQEEQEPLMASAWEQVEGVLALNEKLRQAQLAREVSVRLRDRHLLPLDVETVVQVSAPWHAQVRASPQTVQAILQGSPIAEGVLAGQFRRVARPRGPIARRQGRPWRTPVRDLLSRLNRGALEPAPPPPTPEVLTTPGRAGKHLTPEGTTAEGARQAQKRSRLGVLLAALLALLGLWLLAQRGVLRLIGLVLTAGGAAGAARAMARGQQAAAVGLRAGLREGSVRREDVLRAPAQAGFVPAVATPGQHTPRPAPADALPAAERRLAQTRLREALADTLAQANAAPAPGIVLEPVDLAMVRAKLVGAVDPRQTLAAALRGRLKVADWVKWQPEDELEPVMAAPEFPQPMYEPLRDLGQEWLLPGVGKIPPNTVSLLATNQRFVEAYMAGLNHEMARELLWREYPTDQRGTYFQQFWDVRGTIPRPGTTLDPEKLKDIKPIHGWPNGAELGENSSRTPPPGGEHLVLVVRGDVLRRYPNTEVYAAKAKTGSGGRRELDAEQRHPVFRGTLEPDLSFFGFELTEDEVRGSTDPGEDQGWFFVLQEQPGEPRFGLDLPEGVQVGGRPTHWLELSWGHLAASAEALDSLVHIDLNAELPDTRLVAAEGSPPVAWHADSGQGPAGARASDIAYITLQRPFRVAIHGSDLLPREED